MNSRQAVIIGGGMSGTLCARELALAGWSVTLLEAAHLGSGSSSRTAAGIRQQFSTPENVRGMRYCVNWYKAFAAEIEAGQSPIVQRGYLFLTEGDAAWAEAQARAQMQHREGLTEVEALDPDALARRFPWVDASAVSGGTFCPSDGFLLPHLVYIEAAKRARQLGATVIQGAPVTGAVHKGGRLSAVHTPKGTFEADLFIDCTNAWTRRLAATLGAASLPVAPLKRYLWFVQREGSLSAQDLLNMPLVITPSGGYCRPENGDTLMIGKKHETPPDFDFTYEDQDVIEPRFSHQSGVDAMPFELWAELAQYLPPIGDFAGINATTCGYYGTTPDHNPFFGYDPMLPNLIRLVGHSGHGAMFGPFTALVAKNLAEAGRDVPEIALPDGGVVPRDAFALDRTLGPGESLVI